MILEEKIRKFLRDNMGYIIVAIVAVSYVSTAFIEMGKTGKTVAEIFGGGAVVFFLGFTINTLFDLQGIMNGERDERVILTVNEHKNMVERVTPYIEKLDPWCERKSEEALMLQRTKILARAGLKYSDFFDEDGTAMGFTPNRDRLKNPYTRKEEKVRIRCYNKARSLKLTPLTAGELTSEGGRHSDPLYLGRSKTEYERSNGIRDVVSKLGTAFLFGYYGVELASDFSYAELIWSVLQVCVLLIMGVIRMYQSYIYMVDEYRNRVVRKIDNLQKFENDVKIESKEREGISDGN